jgi:hypothetical protein
MASRREFLQAGIAALALPISAHAALSPAAGAPEDAIAFTPLYKVVFDERFPAGVAFGAEARSLGLPTHSIRGDITDLWFHDLDAQWKKKPAAVAGLTAQGALFCLERLAWDHGMRVVFRGDHQYLPDGSIEHVLTGPEGVVRQGANLEQDDGDDWAVRVLRLVVEVPEGHSTPAKAMIHGRATAPAGAEPEGLISWVIAPVIGAPIMRKA